jgi:hypothetical protein
MQLLSDRQHDIITLARTLGRVSVDHLSARFDVTPQTIRRDLNELCERRVLTRTHGGAGVSSCVENLSYDARRFIAAAEKKAIGIAAAALIPNKSSLFVNIGTTARRSPPRWRTTTPSWSSPSPPGQRSHEVRAGCARLHRLHVADPHFRHRPAGFRRPSPSLQGPRG